MGQSWRSRLNGGRTLVDVAIAALVAGVSVLDLVSSSDDPLPGERRADWLAYVLVIAASLALIWRRRAPLVVLGVVTAAVSTIWLRDHAAFLSVLGLTALFATAAHAEQRRRAWWAMVLSLVVLMAAASVSLLDEYDGFAYLTALSMLAFLIGSIVAGIVLRNRERIFVDTERRAAEAEADRLAEAERAVAKERSRIAREMHDVVAHGMSVVAVQAAAGREIVHVDPSKAAEVFARIETVGRESLGELRRMLGVLRDGDEAAHASLAPQPGVAQIADAVAQSTAAGVPTELVIDGDQRALGPGIELAAFRIVQEALTNVRKHAGNAACAKVKVIYGDDSLIVEVIDDGRGAATALSGVGTGHGLIGMRERVEIYGGEFSAGPRPGGGYSVRVSLPAQARANTSAGMP
jgi:signal transduction histidine kinase